MGIQALQTYLENECKAANVAVDFGKLIAKLAVAEVGGGDAGKAVVDKSKVKYRLVMDAECCLDRLYGGLHADWFSGGQWNRMYEFLSALAAACEKTGIKLVVFLNGALEKSRLKRWAREQTAARIRLQEVVKRAEERGTTPTRNLWTAPACLRQTLRLALRQIGVTVLSSMDDHHQEVIAFCRENHFDGIMARDAEYVIFDPPKYFSAQLFKLTFRREMLTTEFIVDTLAKELDVHPERLPVLGALLGNHILTDDDLKEFHKSVTKETSKGLTQTAKQLVDGVADFVRRLPAADDFNAVAEVVFQSKDERKLEILVQRLKDSVQYYINGTDRGFESPEAAERFLLSDFEEAAAMIEVEAPYGAFSSDSDQEKGSLDLGALDAIVDGSKKVLHIALKRHQRGMATPWVHHVLAHRELKLEVGVEDVEDLPSPLDVYREARRKIYGLLLDARRRDDALEEEDLVVKEWYVTKSNQGDRADYVPVFTWDDSTPSLEDLWFGMEKGNEDLRLKAFLTCMNVDEDEQPFLLNESKVPRKFLLLCIVLRHLLRYSHDRVVFFSRLDLEAFLATAVCPVIKNVGLTKEMTLPEVRSRGLALGSLFMHGVEVACFANDACGSPLPWHHTCPWDFFDGKVFQLKLLKAFSGRPLIEICDGQSQQARLVERLREAIFSGKKWRLARNPSRTRSSMPPSLLSQPGHDGMMGGRRGLGPALAPNIPQTVSRIGQKRGGGFAEASARGFLRRDALEREAMTYADYHAGGFKGQRGFY